MKGFPEAASGLEWVTFIIFGEPKSLSNTEG